MYVRNTQAVPNTDSYPSRFSVKSWKRVEIAECTPIQGNCKILKMIDYVAAWNSTSIAHK